MLVENCCRIGDLDDIFIGTAESQGLRNAVNAIKFVLFDDDTVLPEGLKFNSKYEFISNRNGGRFKAKSLSQIDLNEILCKYAMSSFGLSNEPFTITYDDLKKTYQNAIDREYTKDFVIQITTLACLNNIYQANDLLLNNKTFKATLVDAFLNERYIENKRLMLDRFDGVLLNSEIDSFTAEKFLDSFKSLEASFYNIKTRSQDYITYLETN